MKLIDKLSPDYLKLVSKLSDVFMNDNLKEILNGLGNEYDTLLDKGSITAINEYGIIKTIKEGA